MNVTRLIMPRHLAITFLLIVPTTAWAQQSDPQESIKEIDEEFQRKLRELERERLEALAALAERSEGEEADRALENYFRSALVAELFNEAEPQAERVLKERHPSAVLRYLAEVVNIMAEAERGDYEQSLESIVKAVRAVEGNVEAEADLARLALPISARLSLLDTYYQRLAQAGQFEIAGKAFEAIRANAQEGGEPEVLEYLDHRIRQIEMVGRPAPHFESRDIDGQPIRLEDYAGNPVLLVFWATWHRPTADQLDWLKQAYDRYEDRGLHIIGVNLDAMAHGGRPVEEVLPIVRRYAISYNIPWPNIVNAPDEADIAKLYGVTEIPANVLIDREGNISHLDLNLANFDRVVESVLSDTE